MITPRTPIKQNVCLYSIWSGRLVSHIGDIYDDPRGEALFGSRIKRFCCSSQPGVVYNSVVWLEEPDLETAKNILIEYQEKQIALLQEKIDSYSHKIAMLKGQ